MKLEKGYWGSNVETFALTHNGFQAVVDDLDMGTPEQGGDYRIGIYLYEEEYNGEQAIEMIDGTDFDLDRVSGQALKLIEKCSQNKK